MELDANIAEMNIIHCMTLFLFIVGKSSSEVRQTFYTKLDWLLANTTCTAVAIHFNTMVSDFTYLEIHFSWKQQMAKEWVARTM